MYQGSVGPAAFVPPVAFGAESAVVGWSVFSGRNAVMKCPKTDNGSFPPVADDAPWMRYNSSPVVHTNFLHPRGYATATTYGRITLRENPA